MLNPLQLKSSFFFAKLQSSSSQPLFECVTLASCMTHAAMKPPAAVAIPVGASALLRI